MDNFISPQPVLGTLKITPKDWREIFYIGDVHLAIENVGQHQLLCIWADSFHYELHHDKKVLVGDIVFEIMQPIQETITERETIETTFPNKLQDVEEGWEVTYFSNFYHWEHLIINNWKIRLSPIDQKYKVELIGYLSDDLTSFSNDHFFEASFEAELSPKINSKFNWNYTSDNPDAFNKRI